MRRSHCFLLALVLLLSLAGCQAEPAPSSPTASSITLSQATKPSEETTNPTESIPNITAPTTPPESSDTCEHQMEGIASKDSTCTEGGYSESTCTLCGHTISVDYAPLGHTMQDATCTAPKTCTVCGATDGPPLGHSYTDDKCTRCGLEKPSEECDHQFQNVNQLSPTCDKSGSTTHRCTVCGYTYTESIAANGHSYQAATCLIPRTCSICGDTQGNPLGHSYGTDHLCTRCGSEDPNKPAETKDFTVTVRHKSGSTIPNIKVTVYVDSSATAAGSAVTDAKGKAVIPVIPGSSYTVKIIIPPGYTGKESYTFTSLTANITLADAPVLNPNDHSAAQYKVGSTMADFTLTDVDGVTYNLYQLLQKKDAVILNFWFVNCGPCKAEFPHFEEAYKLYADDVQLLTLNHFDSEDAIRSLREQMGLTFPMISENIGMQQGFGIQAYPTTVVIGKDGKIQMIHLGSYNRDQVINLFETYAK